MRLVELDYIAALKATRWVPLFPEDAIFGFGGFEVWGEGRCHRGADYGGCFEDMVFEEDYAGQGDAERQDSAPDAAADKGPVWTFEGRKDHSSIRCNGAVLMGKEALDVEGGSGGLGCE